MTLKNHQNIYKKAKCDQPKIIKNKTIPAIIQAQKNIFCSKKFKKTNQITQNSFISTRKVIWRTKENTY